MGSLLVCSQAYRYDITKPKLEPPSLHGRVCLPGRSGLPDSRPDLNRPVLCLPFTYPLRYPQPATPPQILSHRLVQTTRACGSFKRKHPFSPYCARGQSGFMHASIINRFNPRARMVLLTQLCPFVSSINKLEKHTMQSFLECYCYVTQFLRS